jgi:chitinase
MGYLLQIFVVSAFCVVLSHQLVSEAEFNHALTINGYPPVPHNIYAAFIAGLPYGSITTRQEAAMALTQFMHESDGLRARREYACEHPPHCPDHYRTPGCDAPGQFYFGRGYIQLTWCGYNYRPFSLDYFGDQRLVNDPDAVARDDNLAWDSAFWFWRTVVHNFPGVQQGHFGATTRAINGALECNDPNGHHIARRRFAMYGQVRSVWGLPGAGIETGCYN